MRNFANAIAATFHNYKTRYRIEERDNCIEQHFVIFDDMKSFGELIFKYEYTEDSENISTVYDPLNEVKRMDAQELLKFSDFLHRVVIALNSVDFFKLSCKRKLQEGRQAPENVVSL
ncbi:hypothetical protein [Photobacterium kishitanii]|uniref:Uncharacterized protein n=1 Tax=Photobacterium kishitanii TaxID=318456 RepID=A0A2T3KL43_9GAMM|nr:hypothetical protein [Photobacterium kishitanii]PSV00370.1 hypothetical protein C9J27_04380 [Photobacterium kishitanii]